MRRLLLMVVLLTALSGCCRNTARGDFYSPAKKYIATLYERGCGATTPTYTMVSIRASSRSFSHGDYVFAAQWRPSVELEWLDEGTLKIRCFGCEEAEDSYHEVFRKEGDWNGIRLLYEFQVAD